MAERGQTEEVGDGMAKGEGVVSPPPFLEMFS